MHTHQLVTTAGRITARALFAALRCIVVLALLAGGMGQTPLAQAAPANDASIGVWLMAEQVGVRHTICVGDEVQIRIMVLKKIEVAGRGPVLGRLPGVNVRAAVVGSGGVGSISPANSSTSLRSNPIGATYFTFKAEKPGVVFIDFKATVNRITFLGLEVSGDTVTAQTGVQVEDCKYRLSLTSRWQVAGEANIKIVARIKIAGMVEDGGGHYSGTARVMWLVFAGDVGDCSGIIPPDSTAEAVGQVYGPEEFIVDVAYETAPVTIDVNCKGAGGGQQILLSPKPVTFSVPASGGNQTLAHILIGPDGPMQGTVVVIVQRAQGQ